MFFSAVLFPHYIVSTDRQTNRRSVFLNTSHVTKVKLLLPFSTWRGDDRVVSIATRYGLDGPAIDSWPGRDFPPLSRPVLPPTQLPTQWVLGLFPGGKAAGA